MEVLDALEDNIDFETQHLLIKKFGKSISQQQAQNGISAFFYENPKIKAYSYAIINDSNRNINATLDVSASNNMVHNLPNPKVSKIVEGNTVEFMIHSMPLPNKDMIYREANLSYKFVD